MAGNKLAHYDVLEKIGAGGMGVVYRAHDSHLNRTVAIKLLPAEVVGNSDRKRRFVQEAMSASSLNHPNIVTIHDIGTENGSDYIVMEYIAGRTLDHVIPRAGMKVSDLLTYSVPVADALARAHAAGIIHRDIKPGNIMIGDDGQVKLLDFGLAKLSEARGASESMLTDTIRQETLEGTVMGTASYMSPEQAEGRKVDARSDIFSFGAVLYEMATGQRAFQGSSQIATLSAILHTEPKRPAELHSGIPPELEKIVLRCLRKDPAWRFQSAADLKISLHDLRGEIESAPSPPVISGGQSGRSYFWIAALAAGLSIGGATSWWIASRRPPEPSTYGRVRPLTTYSGQEYDPALSPDGNRVAFSWNGEKKDNFDIYVRLVDGGAALRLTTDPTPDRAPVWSPDSGHIAFLRGNAIYVVPSLGGVERRLLQFSRGQIPVSPMSWSPDGKLLAFAGSADTGPPVIWIASTESGEARRVTTSPKGYLGDGAPAFSPDGNALAFTRSRDLLDRAVLLQDVSPDGSAKGEPKALTSYSAGIGQLAWAPDGKSLLATQFAYAGRIGLWRLNLAGKLFELGVESSYAQWPSTSRTGNRLAYQKVDRRASIFRLDGPGPDGGPRRFDECHPGTVIETTVSENEPMLSSDGRRLLFTSDRSGFKEIYAANSDGSGQTALTHLGATFNGSPRWSPDGQTAAFDRYEQGHSVIYTVPAESGKPRRMTDEPFGDSRPSFSRDGKWIYFASTRSGPQEIWKIPSTGGPPQQVTHNSGTEAFESADGRDLYYANNHGVWSLPVRGGDPRLILPEARPSGWAVAGASIYYFVAPDVPHRASLWVWRRESGRKFEYVRFPDGFVLQIRGTSITVSPDERTIMYRQDVRNESDLMLVENFR